MIEATLVIIIALYWETMLGIVGGAIVLGIFHVMIEALKSLEEET